MDLILATNNKNKVKEMKEILGDINGIDKILTLQDIGFDKDIKTGKRYIDNAILKVNAVREYLMTKYKQADYIVIGDDSGLEIEALGNVPGIYSHRFLGEDVSQEMKNRIIVHNIMNVVPNINRKASYKCYMALSFPLYGDEKIVYGCMNGYIGYEIDTVGKNGFGYDPIFYIDNVSAASMDHDLKLKISHRYKALNRAKARIEEFLELRESENNNYYE